MPTKEELRLASDIETLTEEMTNLELVSAVATGEQRDYYQRQLKELGDTKATKELRLKALTAGRLGTLAVAVLLLLASIFHRAEVRNEQPAPTEAGLEKEVRRG